MWLSVSADLMGDAQRDLADIGADFIPVKQLTSCEVGKKIDGKGTDFGEGILFLTYTGLGGKASGKVAMGGRPKTRLQQVLK